MIRPVLAALLVVAAASTVGRADAAATTIKAGVKPAATSGTRVAAPAITLGPGVMTLAQAIDFAQAHNSAVQQSYSQAVAAAAALAKARSVQLPLVQGQLQNQMNRQTSSGNFAQFGLSPNPNFSQNTAALLGSLNVINLNDTLTAREAKNSLDAALENLRLAREQTTFAVETDYYNYVQVLQLANVAQADLAYNNALLLIAQANYRAGRVAGIDALKAQVQVASSSERLASAQADAEDARENLALAIGADPASRFAAIATIPEPPAPALAADDFHAVALAHRPEIGAAQDGLSNSFLANAQIDAPNRPTVSLNGAWGNQDSPTARAQQFNQCHAAPGIFPCPGTTHFYSIGLLSTWSLPLLDWGSVHASHTSARAAIDAQKAVLDNAQRQAFVDVDQAVRRLKVDKQNLNTAAANAQLAKQVAQVSQVQYRVGVIGQIDAVASEQAYLQAAKDLVAAQVAYVLGIEKLKLATGTL